MGKKFKRIYVKKKDEISVIYIRFKYANLRECNYVGQSINYLNGRPFRRHAYGGSYKGRVKYQSLMLLRCPPGRLDTREAYFILKHRPSEMNLSRYFRKAWHLLKKSEMLDILTEHFLLKHQHSPQDWKRISQQIHEIGTSNDKVVHFKVLKNLQLVSDAHVVVWSKEQKEHNKKLTRIEREKIKRGELLDISSTLDEQQLWHARSCKKFLGYTLPFPKEGVI